LVDFFILILDRSLVTVNRILYKVLLLSMSFESAHLFR